MMAAIQAREWVTTDMIDELSKCFTQDPTDVSIAAAMALGAMGEQAASAANVLLAAAQLEFDGERVALLNRLDRMDRGLYLEVGAVYATCLGRVDPQRGKALFRTALKHVERGDIWFLSDTVIDAGMVGWLVEALRDRDRDVVWHAMEMAGSVGLPATQATDRLIEIAGSHRDAAFRSAAAMNLAFLAWPHHVPKLRALMQRERSKDVRYWLARTIRAIDLETAKQ